MKAWGWWWTWAVLAVLGVATVITVEVDADRQARHQDDSLSSAASMLENRFFLPRKAELDWLSSRPEVREFLAGRAPAPTTLLRQTADLLQAEASLLVNLHGRVAAASRSDYLGIDVSSREYFRKALARLSSYALLFDPLSRQEDPYAAVPVFDGGALVGAAVLRARSDTLPRWQAEYPRLLLVDGTGRVVSSQDARFQEGARWQGAGLSRVTQNGQWQRVRRRALDALPGFVLVSLESERFPWGLVLLVNAIVLLSLATGGLLWNQGRLTSQRREEVRIREQREQLLSNLLEGIAVFDAAGLLVWANPSFHRMVQRPSPLSLVDLWDESNPGAWLEVLEGRRPAVVFEAVLRGGEGGWVPVTAGFAAANQQFLLSVLDGSERYRSDQLLRQSQKLTVLGQMAGGIAHDLNNMLGVLVGMVDLMKMSVTDEGLHETVDLMLSTLGRASSLAERMLAFARKTPIQRVRVDLAALVRELRFLSATALPAGVTALVDVPESMVVEGDDNLLLSALLNLVLNAGDASAPGSVVRVQAFVEGRRAVVVVEDQGKGMDRETLSRIFEPFFSTKEDKGTGLGLSLVRRTILEHRGSLDVRSTPGQGTTVTVSLPLA